jgi:large repetitive protein
VNRSLNAGDTLSATVSFDDVVTLNAAGGSPTLALQIGSSVVQATYISGTGTNTWIFTATIVAGLNDTDGVSLPLNALTLNGAILSDAAGNACVITSAVILSNPLFLVDTTVPTVVITSDISVLKAGDTANITFTLSEETVSSFAWDGSAGDVAVTGGTLSALTGTGLTRTAVFTPDANLTSGSASITVTAQSYEDAAGNLGAAGASPSFSLDTVAPTLTNVLLSSAIGASLSPSDATVSLLNAGDTLLATVTFSEVIVLNITAGSPTLELTVGSSTVQASYVSGSGTNALVFSTAIVNGQTDNDGVAIALNALHLNGASLKDAAGNAAEHHIFCGGQQSCLFGGHDSAKRHHHVRCDHP